MDKLAGDGYDGVQHLYHILPKHYAIIRPLDFQQNRILFLLEVI
jgi:hypothetical protein